MNLNRLFRAALLGASAMMGATTAGRAADMEVLKAPPPASQQVTGYVELYGGGAENKFSNTFCDFEGPCSQESDKIHGWVLGGAGRVNYWWSPGASLQLDAQAEGTSFKADFGNGVFHFSDVAYLVGGHASWRNSGSLVGVFGAAGDAHGVRHGMIGAEAQVYWNQFTLYAQVGYDTTVPGPLSSSVDAYHHWFVRGTGRYFVNPNLLLEGTVLYASGQANSVQANTAKGATLDFIDVFGSGVSPFFVGP
ncbi:MAG TPA: hypothetical protein VK148_22105 [Xanthobacteraceae bacterium]|nr:hypothetical protein [Xanthobacteraceae bacterium]